MGRPRLGFGGRGLAQLCRTELGLRPRCLSHAPSHWVTWLWPPVCLPSVPGPGSPHPREIGIPTSHFLSAGAGGAGALGGAGVPGGVAGESKAQDRLGREEDRPVESPLPPPNPELLLCPQESDLRPLPLLPKPPPKLPSMVSTGWGAATQPLGLRWGGGLLTVPGALRGVISPEPRPHPGPTRPWELRFYLGPGRSPPLSGRQTCHPHP